MNRRSFLSGMIAAAAGCFLLPSAQTYKRTWSGLLVPREMPVEPLLEGKAILVDVLIRDNVDGKDLHPRRQFIWRPGEEMTPLQALRFTTDQIPTAGKFVQVGEKSNLSVQMYQLGGWSLEHGQSVLKDTLDLTAAQQWIRDHAHYELRPVIKAG